MPVGSYAPVTFTGNGVTTVTPYNFKVFDQTHIRASLDGVVKTLGSHYTVDGVGNSTGGNVTWLVAPAAGVAGLIERNVPYVRTEDYQSNGDFREITVDKDFDTREMQIQQLKALLDRVPKISGGSVLAGDSFALPAPGAGYFIRWNVAGTALEAVSTVADSGNYIPSGTGVVASRSVNAKLGDWVSAADYGTTVTDWQEALDDPANPCIYFPPGTYALSTIGLNVRINNKHVLCAPGVFFTYTETGRAIKISGVSNCKWLGQATVTCTNTAAWPLLFEPTASAHCQFNYAEFHTLAGGGRGAAPGTLTNGCVEFERINGSFIAYYNKVKVHRLADANTLILFDAPNALPGDGANGNEVEFVHVDNYWFGAKFRASGDAVKGGGAYGSPGSGSDIPYLFYFENSTAYNTAACDGGEPGLLSAPYYVATGSNYNKIDGQFSNFPGAGTDLGFFNDVRPGNQLYKGSFATTAALLENTNYRIAQLTVGGSNAFVTTIRWRSLNTTAGEYGAGRATIMGSSQGGVTIERIISEVVESDSVFASQTRFAGVQVDGFNVYFVFAIRNRGGANATTQILVEADSLGPAEFKQSGPTVTVAAITHPAFETYKNYTSVSSSGTGEDILMSTSLPAALMKRTGTVRITVGGTKTGAAGNKTVKLYFGTVSMTISAAANDTNNWRGVAEVSNVASASAQDITGSGHNGATAVTLNTTGTENTANAVTVTCTGECANGADTITQTMMMIEYLP